MIYPSGPAEAAREKVFCRRRTVLAGSEVNAMPQAQVDGRHGGTRGDARSGPRARLAWGRSQRRGPLSLRMGQSDDILASPGQVLDTV